jgi:ribulose bisphosphate carboxylase small subunit
MTPYAYELWDLETRNLVDAFGSEADALAAVRDALAQHGSSYVASWALARATRRRVVPIAEGSALIARATAARAAAPSISSAAD